MLPSSSPVNKGKIAEKKTVGCPLERKRIAASRVADMGPNPIGSTKIFCRIWYDKIDNL